MKAILEFSNGDKEELKINKTNVKKLLKLSLEFDKDEREEFECAINGSKYKSQIEDIWDKCFRPIRKHGYCDEKINDLLKKTAYGEDGGKYGNEIIDLISEIYFDIKNEE